MIDLAPDATTAIKLASLAVHVEEMLSGTGHHYDRVAIESILADPDVREYLARLDGLALLPKKRDGEDDHGDT